MTPCPFWVGTGRRDPVTPLSRAGDWDAVTPFHSGLGGVTP